MMDTINKLLKSGTLEDVKLAITIIVNKGHEDEFVNSINLITRTHYKNVYDDAILETNSGLDTWGELIYGEGKNAYYCFQLFPTYICIYRGYKYRYKDRDAWTRFISGGNTKTWIN